MSSFADAPIAFRNVVRYVKDLDANAKLYQALGFEFVARRGDMLTFKNAEGLSLILHQYDFTYIDILSSSTCPFSFFSTLMFHVVSLVKNLKLLKME